MAQLVSRVVRISGMAPEESMLTWRMLWLRRGGQLHQQARMHVMGHVGGAKRSPQMTLLLVVDIVTTNSTHKQVIAYVLRSPGIPMPIVVEHWSPPRQVYR